MEFGDYIWAGHSLTYWVMNYIAGSNGILGKVLHDLLQIPFLNSFQKKIARWARFTHPAKGLLSGCLFGLPDKRHTDSYKSASKQEAEERISKKIRHDVDHERNNR